MARKKKAVILREELRQLVDQLPDRDLYAAKRFLAFLCNTRDPLMQKLVEAPYDDEPLTQEDKAALAEAWEAIARGEVYTDEEVRRELGLRAGKSVGLVQQPMTYVAWIEPPPSG